MYMCVCVYTKNHSYVDVVIVIITTNATTDLGAQGHATATTRWTCSTAGFCVWGNIYDMTSLSSDYVQSA